MSRLSGLILLLVCRHKLQFEPLKFWFFTEETRIILHYKSYSCGVKFTTRDTLHVYYFDDAFGGTPLFWQINFAVWMVTIYQIVYPYFCLYSNVREQFLFSGWVKI